MKGLLIRQLKLRNGTIRMWKINGQFITEKENENYSKYGGKVSLHIAKRHYLEFYKELKSEKLNQLKVIEGI